MVGYVYHITCEKTNKKYIGITANIQRRFKKHKTELQCNKHHSPKLQNAWNFYGMENFTFSYREVEIEKYEDLSQIEIDEIKKYDSFSNGYNCTKGGISPKEWKQEVKNEDCVIYLCILEKYGDGYGKTCEEIFKWPKGTASKVKSRERFFDANAIFEKLSKEERARIAEENYIKLNVQEKHLNRQLKQGGCEKSYILNQEDFNFAFAAQELFFGYSCVANYLEIKPATVKDWFNGRSRKRNKELYNQLSEEEKNKFKQKVLESNLESLQNDRELLLRTRKLNKQDGCV